MARSTFPTFARQNDFPTSGSSGRSRTYLAAPLRQQGEFIGGLIARRTEVRPFTPAQIKLLETFADQAVIAIENVRLFNELKESLEQQTATSEILGVIASSPTDIQPVLDAVAENAARNYGIRRRSYLPMHGDNLIRAAKYGPHEWGPLGEIGQRLSRGTPAGRAIIDRQTDSCPGSSRRAIGVSRRPKAYPVWQSDRSLHAVTPRRCSDRRDSYSPHGGSSVYREADRAS